MMNTHWRRCVLVQLYEMVALVWATHATSDVVNPGLKIRLSQPGLNYAASVGVDLMADKIKALVIPNQSGSANVPAGYVEYQVNNLRVVDFHKPSATLTLNPGHGMTLSVGNAAITVHGSWSYKYHIGALVIRDNGGVDASAAGVSASITFNLGMDLNGHLNISSLGCNSQVSQLKITLSAKFKWFYDLFIQKIEPSIRNSIQKSICDSANTLTNVNATKELEKLPFQQPMDNLVVFDYRLVAPPQFSASYFESYHKGEFLFTNDSSESPYRAAEFLPSGTGQMVTIWLSDYILNTMGYVLHKHNILHENLTKAELPADKQGYFNTTCNDVICFGNLVPQVSTEFPNASVEMEITTTAPPTFEISDSEVAGKADVVIVYRARLSNRSLAELFTTNVAISTVVRLELVTDGNMTIRGKVGSLLADISVTDSKVGDISTFVLNVIFNVASEFFIVPKLNVLLQKGIQIPTISNLRFNNTVLDLESHAIRVASDLTYVSPKSSTLYYFKKHRNRL